MLLWAIVFFTFLTRGAAKGVKALGLWRMGAGPVEDGGSNSGGSQSDLNNDSESDAF